MGLHVMTFIRRRSIFLTAALIATTVLLAFAGGPEQQVATRHKVHIAFGFHVNLYHSFRNDTNDEDGFGKDIRIIRHIIRTLDRFNAEGVPVRGVWDFDNLFSLQEILPRHAPDIITAIQRRVRAHGDEVILMSYNNGMVSAMTRDELNDAVRWAINNPWQSGVQDIFESYSPIVRPQEMMTTAGNFDIYKAHGIEAVSLYYSATPFDTFRVFSRALTRTEAHNPLTYRHPHTDETMTIIPTYHFGDLLEHVSLKQWVKELQALQRSGEMDHDALIFLNYDADSELWSGIDMPWAMDWLPATGGLEALVEEVRHNAGVQFTTLKQYLKHHPPVGTVSFSQDTADGSFNGYNSWAEKADTAHFWTAIERNRRVCDAADKAVSRLGGDIDAVRLHDLIAAAEQTRLRALSTTNFGMATPFLARQRRLVMADLVNALEHFSDDIRSVLVEGLKRHKARRAAPSHLNDGAPPLDTVLIMRHDDQSDRGSRFLSMPLPVGFPEGADAKLISENGRATQAINLGIRNTPHGPHLKLFIPLGDGLADGIYDLYAAHMDAVTPASQGIDIRMDANGMSNGPLAIRFEDGQVEGVYFNGQRQVDAGSLSPRLTWEGEASGLGASRINVRRLRSDRMASFQLSGELPGPTERSLAPGRMDYTYTVIAGLPYVMLDAHIQYPATASHTLLKTSAPGLIRRVDMTWHEVAPAEIRFTPAATLEEPLRILKENYLGIASAYDLDYFRHHAANRNLDNVNNHITQAYVGIVAGRSGMAVAKDNSVQSNFAFAPVRQRFDSASRLLKARVNPFGTYHGRQYQPPTWGNGNGYSATLLAGEQFASAGPTYNGTSQRFSLLVGFFDGRTMPPSLRQDLIDFANPPTVISMATTFRRSPRKQSPKPPMGLVAAVDTDGAVRFAWDSDEGRLAHFRIYCGTSSGRYDAIYPATGNSIKVDHFTSGRRFDPNETYYAAIERVSANGLHSGPGREIRFNVRQPSASRPDIPLNLELKVMWANLAALIQDWRGTS